MTNLRLWQRVGDFSTTADKNQDTKHHVVVSVGLGAITSILFNRLKMEEVPEVTFTLAGQLLG